MAMIWVAGALLLLASSGIYPYLPGGHDPLAVPVSQVVQVAAATALLLVPIWPALARAPGTRR